MSGVPELVSMAVQSAAGELVITRYEATRLLKEVRCGIALRPVSLDGMAERLKFACKHLDELENAEGYDYILRRLRESWYAPLVCFEKDLLRKFKGFLSRVEFGVLDAELSGFVGEVVRTYDGEPSDTVQVKLNPGFRFTVDEVTLDESPVELAGELLRKDLACELELAMVAGSGT